MGRRFSANLFLSVLYIKILMEEIRLLRSIQENGENPRKKLNSSRSQSYGQRSGQGQGYFQGQGDFLHFIVPKVNLLAAMTFSRRLLSGEFSPTIYGTKLRKPPSLPGDFPREFLRKNFIQKNFPRLQDKAEKPVLLYRREYNSPGRQIVFKFFSRRW